MGKTDYHAMSVVQYFRQPRINAPYILKNEDEEFRISVFPDRDPNVYEIGEVKVKQNGTDSDHYNC